MYPKKIFLLFLYLFISLCRIFSLSSKDIFEYFERDGLKPEKQLFSSTMSSDFPFNIVFHFGVESDKKLYILLSQEDAVRNLRKVASCIKTLDEINLLYPVDFVLLANDYSSFNRMLKEGTNQFISNLAAEIDPCVILLSDIEEDFLRIEAGSRKQICPRWLLESLIDVYSKNEKFDFKVESVLLYNLGFLTYDQRLSVLQRNEIPAVKISGNIDFVFQNIDNLIVKLGKSISANLDVHYFCILWKDAFLFVTENSMIIFIIIIIAISLFFFFNTVWGFENHKDKGFDEFLKVFFLIPSCIVIFYGCILLGQELVKQFFSLRNDNPIIIVSLKICFAGIIFAIFANVQKFISFPKATNVYGFLIIIMSYANIFFFSSVNIIYLFLFIPIFFNVFITHKMKSYAGYVFRFIFINLPYLPYVGFIMKNREIIDFFPLINSSLGDNFLLVCIFMPSILLIIQFFVKMGQFGKHRYFSFPFLTIALFVFFIGLVIYFYSKIDTSSSEKNDYAVKTETSSRSIETYRVNFLSKSYVNAYFTDLEDVLKINVTVSTPNGISVYESNFPYQISIDNKTARFNFSENPPKSFELEYTTEKDIENMLEIVFLVKKDDGIHREKFYQNVPVTKNSF